VPSAAFQRVALRERAQPQRAARVRLRIDPQTWLGNLSAPGNRAAHVARPREGRALPRPDGCVACYAVTRSGTGGTA